MAENTWVKYLLGDLFKVIFLHQEFTIGFITIVRHHLVGVFCDFSTNQQANPRKMTCFEGMRSTSLGDILTMRVPQAQSSQLNIYHCTMCPDTKSWEKFQKTDHFVPCFFVTPN